MHLKIKPTFRSILFLSALVISILIFSGCVGQEETTTTTTPETKETTTTTTPETKETTTITTKKPLADLVVANLTHSPATPTTVDQIIFTAVVKNIGTGSAGSSTLSIKVGGETFPPTYSVPTLTPGTTHTVERKDVLGIPQNYQVTATVDVNNDVEESNENNNEKTDKIKVIEPLPAIPAAPSDLTKTNEFPCTIEWTDNSDNEDGFNIYIGGSCVDCEATTDWILVDTVGKDVITYTWTTSCCSVAECSCAMVRAFNESGESQNSNIIMLAPVC